MATAFPTVTINCDDQVSPLLAELSEVGKQLIKAGFDLPDLPIELVTVDSDCLSATGASEVLVTLKPADGLLQFASTVRAIHAEWLLGN